MNNYQKIIEKSRYKKDIKFDSDDSKIKLINVKNDLLEIVKFIRADISKDIRIEIKTDIVYDNSQFSDKVDLSNCDFYGELLFIKCVFDEDVSFKAASFNGKTSFEDSKFNSKVRFHWAKFKVSTTFRNTVFEDLVDFYCATFEKTQQFHLTDFLSIAIFSNVIFEKQVQFLYNKVNNNTIISFESSNFKQSLDLSRSNFWCKLNFWASRINPSPDELWLYETDEVEEKKLSSDVNALKRLRESFRIIKYQFRKEGNNIEAINFHKVEMELYRQELNTKPKKKKENATRFSLWLNKISNNFGTSWFKGIIFTLLTSLLFYCIFLITLFSSSKIQPKYTSKALEQTLTHWLEFLNITKWNFKYFDVELSDLGFFSYLVLFISRIFIGYGYYQIVQAFRKYGKN